MSSAGKSSSHVETHEGTPSMRLIPDAYNTADSSVRVQLRPVGHPSPVTQLFEYALKAWDNQKGDHCTYKYIPSRESHLEMCATVLVRLPDKPSLMVKDTKFRQSRVLAQNAVAQLALHKLAQEDPDLKEKLDQMAKEVEQRKATVLNGDAVPPPPPPPSRYTSYPAAHEYQHFHWSSGGGRGPARQQQHYYYNQPAPAAYAPYYAPMGSPLSFYPQVYPSAAPNRSNSAPELNEEDNAKFAMPEYVPYDMYYPMAPPPEEVVLPDGTTPSSGLMTPTCTAPPHSWGTPAAGYYPYPPMDMYYPPPMMMGGPVGGYMPPNMVGYSHAEMMNESSSSTTGPSTSESPTSSPLCH